VLDEEGNAPGCEECREAEEEPTPRGYWAADESGVQEHYPDAEDGSEAAEEYVSSGDWEIRPRTWWCSVTTWPDGHEDETTTHLIAVEPEEPSCGDSKNHDWVEVPDGTRGLGGGVMVEERCSRCGRGMITRTWDTDPVSGIQGLYSVEYLEPEDEYEDDGEDL
jgi:hypothetical protein